MQEGAHSPAAAQILFRVVLPIVAFATPLMLAGIAVRARRAGLSRRSSILLFVLPLAAALPLIGLMMWIAVIAMSR